MFQPATTFLQLFMREIELQTDELSSRDGTAKHTHTHTHSRATSTHADTHNTLAIANASAPRLRQLVRPLSCHNQCLLTRARVSTFGHHALCHPSRGEHSEVRLTCATRLLPSRPLPLPPPHLPLCLPRPSPTMSCSTSFRACSRAPPPFFTPTSPAFLFWTLIRATRCPAASVVPLLRSYVGAASCDVHYDRHWPAVPRCCHTRLPAGC